LCLSNPRVKFIGLCCLDDGEEENAIAGVDIPLEGRIIAPAMKLPNGLSGSGRDASSWIETDQLQTEIYFSPKDTRTSSQISCGAVTRGYIEQGKPTQCNGKRSKPENKDKSIKIKNPKSDPYNLTPSGSPYPNHPHPTPEDCQDIVEILTQADGHITPSFIFPALSSTNLGSEGGQPVLDALMRTVLSSNTSRTNYFQSYKGLVDKFGVLEDGIGKGSVNWNTVRLADIGEVFSSIRCGGLATAKSKHIKEILEIVYQENLAQRKAPAKAAELKGQLLIPAGAQNKTAEENVVKVTSAEDYGLSLEYMHELSSEDALNAMKSFPGIGLTSASIVLLYCLRRPTFAVDTHVFRLCKWLSWVPQNANREATYMHCEARVQDELKRPLVGLLIKHAMNCPRCRSSAREGNKGWERGCPIEHLVERTGKSEGANSANRGKGTNKAERIKGKKRESLETDEEELRSEGTSWESSEH